MYFTSVIFLIFSPRYYFIHVDLSFYGYFGRIEIFQPTFSNSLQITSLSPGFSSIKSLIKMSENCASTFELLHKDRIWHITVMKRSCSECLQSYFCHTISDKRGNNKSKIGIKELTECGQIAILKLLINIA